MAGVFVLTFCMNRKVYHCQLVQVRAVVVVVFFFDNPLDPRRLLKWLFFRPLYAPFASFKDLKKVIT